MMRLILAALLFVSACAAHAEMKSYVRQISFVVESFADGLSAPQPDLLYFLYIGNEETERMDQLAEQSQVTVNVSLVHPVLEADPALRSDARGRWYVTQTDSTRLFRRIGPVFERSTWDDIPRLARHVLLALGPDDEDLILISWSGVSGSLSVFYNPRVQRDRAFFDARLARIREYAEAHDLDEAVPYDRVTPEPDLISSAVR